MAPYDRIIVIFNPASGGTAARLAEQLRLQLASRVPGVPVSMEPSEFAGHARGLARITAAVGRPLIVSVSGDGGYNEVINGVMEVPDSQAVCALLAAGNANDHHRSIRRLPLIEAIMRSEVRRIDLLRLSQGLGRASWAHYAHSYIGLGLTPNMAIGLKAGKRGTLRELVSVLRTFGGLQPVEIIRDDGSRAKIDSLILANVPLMAKYGRISEAGEPDDGLFEVIVLPHARRWRIVLMTLRAVTVGLGAQPSVSRYGFTPVQAIPVQIDGEILHLAANIPVTVESEHRALATLG